ncbi:MAG TPA: hypothetical protein VI318_00770, partial [Baekduia sp.]
MWLPFLSWFVLIKVIALGFSGGGGPLDGRRVAGNRAVWRGQAVASGDSTAPATPVRHRTSAEARVSPT